MASTSRVTRILRVDRGMNCIRTDVAAAQAVVAPELVADRRRGRLHRRTYHSEVSLVCISQMQLYSIIFARPLCAAVSGPHLHFCHKVTLTFSFYIQGANYCWHIDGYDKLSPYGLPIHGCVDGCVHIYIYRDIQTKLENSLRLLRCVFKY